MPRIRPPRWLAAPTRFATLTQQHARIALLLLALLIGASFTALATPGPPPASHEASQRGEDEGDIVLYESIVAGVRGGGDYYAVTAEALRTGDYPLRPFITFRLPTLAVVEAALPQFAVPILLYLLVAAVVLAWLVRLYPAFARPPQRVIAVLLLLAGMAPFLQRELASFHEIWAGLLIALSLALRRPGRWIEAVAFALMAVLIRETALLYIGIMGGLALLERQRREAIGWGVAIGIFALALACHAHAVGQVVHAEDPASPGWSGMMGFGFFVKTMSISTALTLVPPLIAAPLVALALFGWAGWKEPLALRALAILCGYAALLATFARVDTFYWGLLVAPFLLVGLAFVPEALRDLFGAALDRRRIVVTRIAR